MNDTSRRFARTLVDAFPVSEGYRQSITRPRNDPPMFRKPRFGVTDIVCWIVSGGLLLWLAWAALHAPTP